MGSKPMQWMPAGIMGSLLCTGLLALPAGSALGQAFPAARPVTLYVPWTAGGPTDLALRALAESTTRPLGQKILVENKPGVSGAMGATLVATSRPDGYTLTQLPLGVFRLPMMSKTAFDPIKDLTWIINIAGYEFATNVRGDAPWKNWDDFLAYSKANPGKVTYGHPGVGTSPNLVMAALGQRLGIQWVDVPYKGSSDTVTALRAGQIMAVAGSPPWPFVKSGEVRPLITWGPKRSPKAPDVPTLKERYGILANSPWGIGGAPGMDARTTKVLHDAFRKAMDDPALEKALDAVNMELFYMAGEDYMKWIRETNEEERKAYERIQAANK